jgi:ribose transport system permease protein
VPAGVWGGALFFILLGGLLNLIGWNFAGQNVLKGFLVLAVLFLASGTPIFRKRPMPHQPPISDDDKDNATEQIDGPAPHAELTSSQGQTARR